MKTSEWNTLLKEQHERPMRMDFPDTSDFTHLLNTFEFDREQPLHMALSRLSQAHHEASAAVQMLAHHLAPMHATSGPLPLPTGFPAPAESSHTPSGCGAQSIPQRKDTYAIQNPAVFGNSIFGRTERIYQQLAAAAKNIAQQDVAAAHEGRGVMLLKLENKFLLLSINGQADLTKREFAELELALEAAAMFLSGLNAIQNPEIFGKLKEAEQQA